MVATIFVAGTTGTAADAGLCQAANDGRDRMVLSGVEDLETSAFAYAGADIQLRPKQRGIRRGEREEG